MRSELVDTVAQSAVLQAEDDVRQVTCMLAESKERVQRLVSEGRQAAYNIATFLEPWEAGQLLAEFQFNDYWSAGAEAESVRAAQHYQTQIEQFSDALLKASAHIEQTDSEGAAGFNGMLDQARRGWGK